MKKNYILTMLLSFVTVLSFGQDMVITGAFDGPLTGGTPKAIEIYVINDISDLSTYGFGSANNGGGTDGQELEFEGSASAGDYIYITDGETNFDAYFGFTPDYVSNSASVNGDDALELYSNGAVIDTFGDISESGSGTDWNYLDGWAYRNDSTDPDGATFTISNWTFSGINAVDGCTLNTSCDSVFPVGTYTPAATSTTVVLQDFSNLTNTATADVYGGFGGGLTATNALVDGPVDASNKVRTVTTTAGGDTWKGVFFRPQTHYIDLTSTKTVSVKVYSTTATYLKGIIQAGQSGQTTIELETSEAHTGSGWETLTFTFPTATGEWGELALRTNVDASGALIDPAVEVLEAHFDDLTADQGSEIPAPASGPTDSPTAPTADAADVVSVFSDAYTNIATNYNPGWGQSGSVSTSYDPGDGNNVMLYSNFNFQGTDLTTTDLTAMEKLHIDIWVADASVRTIKVSPIGGSETLVTVPVTSGAWNSVDIPLSSFTAVNFAAVAQLKFDGQFAADGTTADTTVRSDVYLDNIYFYKESTPATTTVLQDFSNLTNTATADVYGGFGGGLTATNALVDGPVDASNKVRTVTTTAGGDTWKGVFFRPQTHYIDLTSTKTVSVKVYSTTATYLKGIIQAGQSGQTTIELETSEAHTGSGWETLTFTFPTATGEWGELALRTNVDASGALIDPAVEVLEAHFDDLTAAQGSEIPAPASGPTDSPTAPTADAADVVSVFSDAYTNIATNYNPGWGQSGSVSTSYDPGDGNNVMLYSNFNFQGTDLTTTDLTAMEKLHIDIWVADASVRTIKVSPIGGSETLVTVPVTSGAWNSVDIPLSSFTAVNFAAVAQLKFDGQFAADGTTADTTVRSDVYLDNIYFYKESTPATTTVLQDFSNLTNTATADVYGGFGGGLTATNALVDGPVDASNKVRTVTTTAGGDTWKGVFFRPQTHYIDLTSTKTVSVKVYSTTATYLKGIIQAGQSGQTTIELETSEAHTGSGWETLTFTFPTATGEWGELALRTNVDASGALIDPAVEVLEAHFDDLTAAQGSEIPAPASGPTDSPTAPTADAADVVSVFSDAYTNIATNYNPGWGQSGSVSTSYDPGDGNNVMLYSNFNFQGTDLTTTDLTAMEKLHIDIWVADASVRTIKVSPIGGSETLVTVPVTSGAWNSVDIPLSSFTAVNFAAVAQLKFDGQFAADGTTADTTVRSDVYLDNIYFYKESTASVNDNNIIKVSVYPNPSNSDWNFRTPNTVINSVEVFNLLGKRVASQRSNNSTEASISTQGLTSGIYIARITTEQGTKSVKLIKN